MRATDTICCTASAASPWSRSMLSSVALRGTRSRTVIVSTASAMSDTPGAPADGPVSGLASQAAIESTATSAATQESTKERRSGVPVDMAQ